MQDPYEGVVVTLPTYNEAENIEKICRELFDRYSGVRIVVIDDDSPDGTWKIVKDLQETCKGLYVIRRREKGRGTAGRDGFLKALQLHASYVVEMDADFSHHPRYLGCLLQKADENTVVIGSRLVKGGGETGRNFFRKYITLAANWYIRLLLGISVRDCTSGYRVFPRRILEKIHLSSLQAIGPEIVQEMLYRCRKANACFEEVPILFEERAAGSSTFNIKILLRSLLFVFYLRFFYRFSVNKKKYHV